MLTFAQTNFLTLVITLSMLAQNTSASDEQLIRKLLSDFAAARNALDAKALASIFTETSHYTAPGQFLFSGRPEIEKVWASAFSSVPLGRATRTIHSVRVMRPDIAVADVDVIPRIWNELQAHGYLRVVEKWGRRVENR